MKRNLLLITTDQERWFSSDPCPLPAHERLRAAGTSYDHFYAASMACTSARSVMYTGRHAPTTGMLDNVGLPGQPSMTTEIPTLGTILVGLGYVTAYKGKWHLSTEALPPSTGHLLGPRADGPLTDVLLPYGFADYNEVGDDLGGPYEGHHHDQRIAEAAVDWIRSTGAAANAAGRPWCLAVNFVNPHDIMFGTSDPEMLEHNRAAPPGRPAYVGPPDDELYGATWDLPDDPSWAESFDDPGRPAAHRDFAIANRIFTGVPAVDVQQRRHFRDYYVNCLREVDRWVGHLLDGLDGLTDPLSTARAIDDTVIAYTSDHGELAGAHGLFGKGPCSYDENLRLPLIVVDPADAGGERSDAIGSQLDLVPTLVRLAAGPDAELPAELPGTDLSSHTERSAALFAYDGLIFVDGEWALSTRAGMRVDDQVTGRDFSKRGLMRTIITRDHKLSRYFAPGEHHVPSNVDELLARNTVELFDLAGDPGERHNLAAEPDEPAMMLIEQLNTRLNDLIATEIGLDDGHWLPAFPGAPWNTGA